MIRTILAGALLCVLTIHAAEARPRHHHYRAETGNGCSDPVMRPCNPVVRKSRTTQRFEKTSRFVKLPENPVIKKIGPGLSRVMAEGAGRVVAPARFIHGRLVCAVNVGMALAARGIRGTGSRLAKSYLHWGHASGPVPGAVAVFNRRGGGHVAIVHHVRPDGTVIYLNPSSRRQAWQVGPYSRKPIAYRVAGGW